jgi:hypothetical protein
MNELEHWKTPIIFAGSVIVAIALLFLVPESFIPLELGNTILTISTFLFGIMAGFYIVVTTTDYNSMKGLASSETGDLIALRENMLMYDKSSAAKLELLIDEYVRRAFDCELIDLAKHVQPDFEKMKKLIRELPVKEKLMDILAQIRVLMDDLIRVHQNQIVLGTRTLSPFQWFVLIILAVLPIVNIYGLRTGELFFDIIAVVFSSMIVLILCIIRSIDLYVWNEETFSFDIYENVLESIGQLPYYPAESIERKRIVPKEKKYRIGELIDYPKSRERRVEVISDSEGRYNKNT